jgi:iduronate 2-sulfatase
VRRRNIGTSEWRTPPDGAPEFAPTNWGELRQYSQIPESGDLPEELQRTLIHGYHAAVSYMDAQLGRVIEALDESGLSENTIIVLWGDHGWHLGDHGMWCKHSNYEQAARIPLIVIAPGVAESGVVSKGLVESVDIYPTLCNLVGLRVPEGLDGASFDATLKDTSAPTKEAVFHVYPRRNMIGRAVRTAQHRLVEWKRPGADAESAILELYDYEADPDETKNLVAEQPEVVAKLRAVLADEPEAKPQLQAPNASRQRERRNRRRAAQDRS